MTYQDGTEKAISAKSATKKRTMSIEERNALIEAIVALKMAAYRIEKLLGR